MNYNKRTVNPKTNQKIDIFSKSSKDQSGAVLILVAALLAFMLVMVALALDVGYAWVRTRNMQAAADAAAYSGAAGIVARYKPPSTLTSNMYSDEIYGVAAASGFVSGSNGVTVTPLLTTTRPISGQNCSLPNMCVTAKITEVRNFNFIRTVSNLYNLTDKTGNLTYSAKATALIQSGIHYCMLALGKATKNCTLYINGSVTVDSVNCGIAVNSPEPDAMCTKGSALTLNTPISIVGGSTSSGHPALPLITYGNIVADPYALNSALQADLNSLSSLTPIKGPPYFPGGYYENLKSNYTFSSPGTYYFNSIDGNNGTITGPNGVTLVFNNAFKGGGNVTYNIQAPTSGLYNGIAIASLTSHSIDFRGDFSGSFSGALYFPNADLSSAGNINLQCMQIVADSIELKGNTSINNDSCISLPGQIYPKKIQLIE